MGNLFSIKKEDPREMNQSNMETFFGMIQGAEIEGQEGETQPSGMGLFLGPTDSSKMAFYDRRITASDLTRQGETNWDGRVPFFSRITADDIAGKKGTIRYQMYETILNTTGIQMHVKSKDIPGRYGDHGTLEIRLGNKNDPNIGMIEPMCKMTSSDCDEKKKMYYRKVRDNLIIEWTIEFCLTNTDMTWKTTKEHKREDMFIGTKTIEFACGLKFDVKITEMKYNVQTTISKLCDEESNFFTARKEHVFRKLQSVEKMSITSLEDVPHIAVIGSGGGIRAVIGMSAAMTVLKEENILDYTMYIAGLSGSAWYILTLYANDEIDPNTVKENIRENLHNFNGTKSVMLWKFLKYLRKDIHFGDKRNATFTNAFGEMIARLLLKEKCENKWSDRQHILQQGGVPLPLIAALHVRNQKTRFEHNEWIEFSPYQAFIPRYGAGINMKLFGSLFCGGFCLERYSEKPIAFLQGMCGSAYTIFRDFRPADAHSGEESMFRSIMNPGSLSGQKKWYTSLSTVKKGICFLFNLFDSLFVARVPNFLYGPNELKVLPPDEDAGYLLWGRGMPAMYYELGKQLFRSRDDTTDTMSETQMLVDAGIAFNSPYPSILRPSRNVELILSFDFSARHKDKDSPFQALVDAEKWANERLLKFPKISTRLEQIERERGDGQYEELYIFEGDDTPTIMHFVLVNKSFRSVDDFDIFPAHETLRFNYTREEFDKFFKLVQHNVKVHTEDIHLRIQTTINRKEAKRLDNQHPL